MSFVLHDAELAELSNNSFERKNVTHSDPHTYFQGVRTPANPPWSTPLVLCTRRHGDGWVWCSVCSLLQADGGQDESGLRRTSPQRREHRQTEFTHSYVRTSMSINFKVELGQPRSVRRSYTCGPTLSSPR